MIRIVFFSVLLSFLTSSAEYKDEKKDRTYFENDSFIVFSRLCSSKIIKNKETGEKKGGFKFVSQIETDGEDDIYFQVIDNSNETYFLTGKFEKRDSIFPIKFVCGVRVSYRHDIQIDSDEYVIFQRRIMWKDTLSSKEIFRIGRDTVDSVMFGNGQMEYREAFEQLDYYLSPTCLIYKKSGKYHFISNPSIEADTVFLNEKTTGVIYEKDGKMGCFGVCEAKYKSIQKFNFFLAKVESLEGQHGYLDINGNEYCI